VIGFALISFMLALAWRNWTISGDDVVEDDVEDRRIARRKGSDS
jgi:multicomponent Na+:H+ antiporter subunit C